MIIDKRQRKTEQFLNIQHQKHILRQLFECNAHADNTDHKTAPDQLARHARVRYVTPPISVHRNVIQPQHPVDQTGSLTGSQEAKEVRQTGNGGRIVHPLLGGLQPRDVLAAKCGYVAAVAQCHVQHVVQGQTGALKLCRIVADEEQLLTEGCELPLDRIVPEGRSQTQIELWLITREQSGLFVHEFW